MANSNQILVGLAVIALIFGGWMYGTYKSMANARIDGDAQLGKINVEFQKRANVLPNMIATADASLSAQTKMVVGYAEAREGTQLANDAMAESQANPGDAVATQKAVKAVQDAKADWATFELNARTESVPQMDLSLLRDYVKEMSAIENVIAYKWDTYNDIAKGYNKKVTVFPGSIVAGICGFEEMKYFEAEAGAENAPVAKFSV